MISAEDFRCEFCRRQFTTELRLVNHLCEPKRRHLQRDDKAVQLGFMAYQRFWQRSMRRKKEATYDGFAKSTLYTAFVRFGRHLISLNAINVFSFIDFLLRVNAKIDQWTNPTLYATYIRELTKTEEPIDALERTFMLMHQWADDTAQDWRHFFRQVETPLAVLWITSGRLSPWVLFTASCAHDLFNRLTAEQIKLIDQAIDQNYWRIKLEFHQNNVAMIRTMLAEHDI